MNVTKIVQAVHSFCHFSHVQQRLFYLKPVEQIKQVIEITPRAELLEESERKKDQHTIAR